jgi:hypothetical protein
MNPVQGDEVTAIISQGERCHICSGQRSHDIRLGLIRQGESSQSSFSVFCRRLLSGSWLP